MKLAFNERECVNCKQKKNCFANCPAQAQSEKAFACNHCDPKKAACLHSCPNNAIFEITKGILSIDKKNCNGCGACERACEQKAITIAFGKAAKCDLCANKNFELACVSACEKKAVVAIEDNREKRKAARLIGWRKRKKGNESIAKTLKENATTAIVQDHSGEKLFLLKNVPSLSLQEAELFTSVLSSFQAAREKKKKSIEQSLEEYCIEKLIELEKTQKQYLLEILQQAAFGFGPLTVLLENDEIEEIAIIGLNKPVFVFDRTFGWLATNIEYCNENTVRNLVNKMAQALGRRLTMQTPRLNAVLENGSRLTAAIEPVSFTGPSITIRKFKQEPFTPIDLVQNKTISAEALAFLWMAMQTDCSVLVAGNTGSGKTSTLNALFSFIPKRERIIAVEETPEINLPHEHLVKLNVVESLGIKMKQLIVETLRMRPDRVIVGEIRDKEEIVSFIDTLLAGQGKGSYATFHAQSATETIQRLKSVGVNELDIASIDLVIVQRRWNKIENGIVQEQRKIMEICEVLATAGTAKLNQLYCFDYKKQKLQKRSESKKVSEKIARTFGFEKKEMQKALEERQNAIERMIPARPKLKEFFEKVNNNEWQNY